MRRSAIVVTALLSSVAAAQPLVPAGFTVRNIAPLLDGQVPQLTVISSSTFGEGVVSASSSGGITTFRTITSSGLISPIASLVDPRIDRVQRIRFDADDLLDGELHATLIDAGANTNPQGGDTTVYVTVGGDGSVTPRWESGSAAEQRAYDFAIVPDLGNGFPGAVLLDGDGTNGTSLATMSAGFVLTEFADNSEPAGRSDIDVWGLQIDASNNYGGGLLLADSDNDDNASVVYELSNVLAGGAYQQVSAPVSIATRFYGDLDIAASGPFGGVIYVTEQVSNEIQQVAPNGTHTTWATGFVGIDSLSISPDGESIYVADLNGVWLIRPEGNEPGPAILATDPSVPNGSAISGSPVNALRVIFTEPVSFTDSDVTITNSDGQPVGFDASGSGSQFMIIGLAEPLNGDTYTVTIADSLTSVATGQPLDGDNDGVAGTNAVLTFTHACAGDIADDFGTPGNDGMVSFGDFLALLALVGPCP